MVEPVLKATVPGRSDLVEVAKAVLAGKTVRLRLEWPKKLRGEQPLEVRGQDVEAPLRLLAKRAGGRVTEEGVLLRVRPQDDSEGERLERLVSSDELAAAEAEPEAEATPEAAESGNAAGAAEAEPGEAPSDDEASVEDREPESAPWGEVRTGDTLPPPAGPGAADKPSRGTLRPVPTPPAGAVETKETDGDSEGASEAEAVAAAESEHDEQVDEAVDAGAEAEEESGPDSGPDIEFHLASSFPSELEEEPLDEEVAVEDEPDAEAEGEGEPSEGEAGDEHEGELVDEAVDEAEGGREPEAEDEDEEEPSELEAEDEHEGELVDAAALEAAAREAEAREAAALDAAARALLAGEPVADERMLVRAGAAGARALCRARVGATADAEGRSRFLAFMRELGDAALVAIREALDTALADATDLNQPAPLEDLLRAAPEVEDDALAQAVSPMCTHDSERVRHAAVTALPKVWGARAKPTLRNALRDEDESVRRAAIYALRRVGGIDVLVLRRLEPILTGDEEASDELRALAAAALADVDPALRDAALDALHRALNPRTSMVSLFVKSEEASPMLVEAICRSMLLIGGRKERRMVSKHAAKSRPPLRQRLQALLDQHS